MPDSDHPPPGHFRYRETEREGRERAEREERDRGREERDRDRAPPFGLDGGTQAPEGPPPGREYIDGRPYERPYPYRFDHCGPEGHGPDIETYDLIDYTVQVGNTGINFVGAVTGWRESDGSARFIPGAIEAVYRRAASTLAFMSLVNGQTFLFLREAQGLTQAQAATICGVPESEISDWEDGSLPVIITAWQTLADMACKADQRAGITWTAAPPASFRPRTIRIYPDISYPPQPQPPCPPPCEPC